jgi:site-specific DNA-methyltransferase (adenine-specific)
MIYQGDSLEVLKTLPDESVDLVVTSPPYNLGINYNSYKDSMQWKDYYEWCRYWLLEIFRVIKKDGRFCLVHYLSFGQSNNRQSPLMELNHIAQQIGFYHHGLAIWWDITLTKRTAWGSWLSASAPYINSPFEGILILYKEKWKKENKGISDINKDEFMEGCSGVWKINPEKNREHPAPFPVALPARCIKLFSFIDDLVLDPFMGSGTTGVACIALKRNFIGIEIDEHYCDIARKRIAAEQAKYSLLERGMRCAKSSK